MKNMRKKLEVRLMTILFIMTVIIKPFATNSVAINANEAEILEDIDISQTDQKEFDTSEDAYFIIKSVRTGKVIEAADGKRDNGSLIQQVARNELEEEQLWYIKETEDNYFQIVNKLTGKAIDIKDGGSSNGSIVHQWEYKGLEHQQWYFEQCEDGGYKIKSRLNHKCLDIVGISNDNGAKIQIWEDVNGENQKWEIKQVGEQNVTTIESKRSKKVIESPGENYENGAILQQWEKENSASNQMWSFEQTNEGYYKIINQRTGKAMDIKDAVSLNGNLVHQWEYKGLDNQLWYLEICSDGYYKIKSKLNHKCLDIAGISDQNAAKIQIWDDVNGENQKWKIEVDTGKDSDEDGLMDVQEIYLGTNPLKADSDEDGLTDDCEVMVTGTDPLNRDSDGNGKIDSLEDLDEDGLTCKEELRLGTSLDCADTDEDGLEDGEEMQEYKTDPLNKDTDGDELNDGDEIKLGLDPLSKDTNQDGIQDNVEKINQNLEVDIVENEKPEVTQIKVQMQANGNIENTTTIESVYEEDVMSSEIEGLIGVPVEITSESDFEEATITFYYDETLLGETEEDNLAIMWYDEENEKYEMYDQECVTDFENNCISYTTTHFSTYMVVDKKKWYETWSKTINYQRRGNSEALPVAYYDFVYTIDCSGSMKGEKISMAKTALKSFVDAMLSKDSGAVVSFADKASLETAFTSDKEKLKDVIEKLSANGGTDVNAGLEKSIEELKENGKNDKKCMVLICDGDVSYQKTVVEKAKDNHIVIYTVLVGNDTSGKEVLDKIAKETNGESYYAEKASEIREVLYQIEENTLSEIDKTDTDKDGIYDTYEIAGMRLPNGKVIYADPMKKDTDGDGLTDGEEMGGLKLDKNSVGSRKYTFYFRYKSNPNKRDTDGDGYKDKEDPRPKKSDVKKVALSKEKNFLKIIDEENKAYYGGDQTWYKSRVAINGACGTVAVANIATYMATVKDKYKTLYGYKNLKQVNFLSHMNTVYKYLTPYKIPFTEQPLGIWPLSKLEKGMKKYAKSCGVELKPVHKHAAYNKKNATKYIISGLKKDLPVALLLGENHRFDGNKVIQPNGESWNQETFTRHWMTITQITIDRIKDKTRLKVSTWGGYAYLDLEDCIDGEHLYQALIYFE